MKEETGLGELEMMALYVRAQQGLLWNSDTLSKFRWGLIDEARNSRQAKMATRGEISVNKKA